ncbi:(d)CMP kinase [Paenibacillus sp. GXUN7292]|uniref:(d)CMP kinase n=1 Tax=Paenibacillus sp. GXUN7292 TaxID=3422499 RepID=UPI003D7E90EA
MSQQEGDRDRINIAIDGPAGAGKSTVARMVAGQLNYVYIDTGAMYRAVTLMAQRSGIEANDTDALAKLVEQLRIVLMPGEKAQAVFVNGEDVTNQIRSREVTLQVSHYAAQESVRSMLGKLQREMAASKGVVMDGRDIGTHVLPDAELKVFLTASVQERALRRYNEIKESQPISLSQLEQEIAERDALDEKRAISPLTRAADALLLDSTGKSIEEVVEEIVRLKNRVSTL